MENVKGEIKLVGKQYIDYLKGEKIHTETFFIILDKKEIHDRTTKIKVGVQRRQEKFKPLKQTF